jgi:hypothetical protein
MNEPLGLNVRDPVGGAARVVVIDVEMDLRAGDVGRRVGDALAIAPHLDGRRYDLADVPALDDDQRAAGRCRVRHEPRPGASGRGERLQRRCEQAESGKDEQAHAAGQEQATHQRGRCDIGDLSPS